MVTLEWEVCCWKVHRVKKRTKRKKKRKTMQPSNVGIGKLQYTQIFSYLDTL